MRCSSHSVGVFHWLAFVVLVLSSFTASILAASEEEYAPLREGDEWTLDVVIVQPNGQKFTATGHRKTGETMERHGKMYRLMRAWIENGPFPFDQTKLVRKDSTGVYSLAPRWRFQTEQTETVLPLKVGQTWTRVNGRRKMNERVISVETIAIGAKTFENCYRIRCESTDGQYVEEYWEAPVVGVVQSMCTFVGTQITMTIREFKPGKP